LVYELFLLLDSSLIDQFNLWDVRGQLLSENVMGNLILHYNLFT